MPPVVMFAVLLAVMLSLTGKVVEAVDVPMTTMASRSLILTAIALLLLVVVPMRTIAFNIAIVVFLPGALPVPVHVVCWLVKL